MKILLLAMVLMSSASSYALVGLPDNTCKSIKEEAAEMRKEAIAGEADVDAEAQWVAEMDCGRKIPEGQTPAVLAEYWNHCAADFDKIYKENCDLH